MAFEPPVCDECGHEKAGEHYVGCSQTSFTDPETGTKYIDMTPDSEGYAAIGATFVASVVSDFKKERSKDATFLLSGIIDLAFGFGYAAGETGSKAEGQALREKLFARIGGRPL